MINMELNKILYFQGIKKHQNHMILFELVKHWSIYTFEAKSLHCIMLTCSCSYLRVINDNELFVFALSDYKLQCIETSLNDNNVIILCMRKLTTL